MRLSLRYDDGVSLLLMLLCWLVDDLKIEDKIVVEARYNGAIVLIEEPAHAMERTKQHVKNRHKQIRMTLKLTWSF